MEQAEAAYLISRLERVVDLLDKGEVHMATAKLLADISALKGMLARPLTATGEE